MIVSVSMIYFKQFFSRLEMKNALLKHKVNMNFKNHLMKNEDSVNLCYSSKYFEIVLKILNVCKFF